MQMAWGGWCWAWLTQNEPGVVEMKAEKSGVGFTLAFTLSEMGNHWGLLSRGVTQSDLHLKRAILATGWSVCGLGSKGEQLGDDCPVQAADPATWRRVCDSLLTEDTCSIFEM